MPAVANITQGDGKTTPVQHTFEPARTSADMAMYEDRAATQYIGYNKLSIALKRPTGPSKQATRNISVEVRLETPVLETLGTNDAGMTPAPTVAYRPMVEVRFTLPERSLKQERKDLRVLIAGLLNQAPIYEAIENFSIPY